LKTAHNQPAGKVDIGTIYRRYIVMVRNRALRILKNPTLADDVAQEVFVRYLQHRRKGGREENPAGLLYRMATNMSLNHLRDTRRRQELLDQAGANPHGKGFQAPDESLVLRQLLAKVSKKEARIASYYYLDDMEHKEIAELLSINRRTVGRRLERFRRHARRLLEVSEPKRSQ
jgi:RNA polymerase sigma-70 factor (ECF subfamily)